MMVFIYNLYSYFHNIFMVDLTSHVSIPLNLLYRKTIFTQGPKYIDLLLP